MLPVVIVLLLLPVTPPQATCGAERVGASVAEQETTATFTERIDGYMKIHNDVERAVAARKLFDDPEDMFEAIEAMQSGIRAARPNARPGTIFTADMAGLIRARLTQTLLVCGYSVEELLAFLNEERSPEVAGPAVNEPFPWALGSSMWPALIAALPRLPEELQYRFADRDLVLIDVHADLVVDILSGALPRQEPPVSGRGIEPAPAWIGTPHTTIASALEVGVQS